MNTTLGKIVELKDCDQGYCRLTLSVNKPFETRLLKINVWEKNMLLKENGLPFEVNDLVSAEYHIKASFPTLDAMKIASIVYCPICGNGLEELEILRIDCSGCRLIPEAEKKELIQTPMTVISLSSEQYKYTVGYKVKLMEKNAKIPHVCVIFPSKLIYNVIPDLKIGQIYLISAWKNDNYLDIIDIC